MTLRNFIRENRAEIDAAIRGGGGDIFNDGERRLWILNDEGLYNWARSYGVNI